VTGVQTCALPISHIMSSDDSDLLERDAVSVAGYRRYKTS
jgi:hypothetical protein